MTSITVKTGAEGPRHDPYHYEEMTVARPDGRVITVHLGLAVWADARWPNGMQRTTDDETEVFTLFNEVAGVTYDVAEKAFHNLPARRIRQHKCGTKHLFECAGYPGESFLICRACGDVIDSRMDMSAII